MAILKGLESLKNSSYDSGKYIKTYNSEIKGIVSDIILGKNLFGIVVNGDRKNIYPFTFDVDKMPRGFEKYYPFEFILIGDSISKDAVTDTFCVFRFRGRQKWRYVLPTP